MTFSAHTPVVRLASVALALGALVLAASMPTSTSSFAEFFGHRAAGCSERTQARLFFGLDGPMGTLSQSEWETFLAEVVTPRFPDGLTVLRASGQWRGTGDRTEQESSRVVEIVYDDSPDARGRIDRIVTSYKARYHQQSVMVARARIEVCF